ADEAAAVDELAGGHVDAVGRGGGGGDLEAADEGAVAVVAESGEDARAGAGGHRIGVLGGDHGQAELPGEAGGGGGRVEADLARSEAAREEGGEVEGSAGAHGRPVVQLELLRGSVGGVLAGDAEAGPELVEWWDAGGEPEAGHRIKGLKDDEDISDVGAGVAEHEGDASAVLAGFQVGDLDPVERSQVGGEDLDHTNSRKKRRMGRAPCAGWLAMVVRTAGSPVVAALGASRTSGVSPSGE